MANISTTETVTPLPSNIRLRGSTTLDLATLGGIVGAFLLIGAAMVIGGAPTAFIDVPALLIVLGGTVMVTAVSSPVRELAGSGRIIAAAILYQAVDCRQSALRVLYLADNARQHGKLSLQRLVRDIRHDRFLHGAIGNVIDGISADDIERLLARETESTLERHLRSAGVLRRAGEVAPAMGLIGTLIGLVQMMSNLSDPSAVGPAMAVALLTTFYGAVLANMVFNPLAAKLERIADTEALAQEISAIGTLSICRQENPRRLEMAINALLPPSEKVSYFD